MLLLDILIGLVVLNVASAAVAAIWIFVSIRLAAFVVIFGSFGLFALSVKRPRLVVLFLFFFIQAGFEAVVLEEYITAAFGAYEQNTAVADISSLQDASIIEFKDGALRPDKYGVRVMVTKAGDSRAGGSFSYVAPYVPADWTPAMPVTVWAVCELSDAGFPGTLRGPVTACGDFGTASKVAVAVPESGFFRAVDNAVDAHSLKSDPKALLVQFVDDPAAYIYGKKTWAVRFPLVLNGLFVIAILVTAFVLKGRKRA